MQKEKVDIDVEKKAQISIVAKETVTQIWIQIMIMEYKQATHYNYCYFFIVTFALCYWYDQETGIAFTGSYSFI